MSSTAVTKREPTEMAEQQDGQVEAIKRILSQRTPPSEIRVREGRGGMKLKYTDGAYVIRTLNQALGWDWDFVADNEELLMNGDKPFEVKVRGTLTVRMNGRAITKTQFGCQPIEMLRNGSAPVSIGDAYKGAATDAMKKCASLLGIALDLYDSDFKAEKYAEPVPPGVSHYYESETKQEPVRQVKLEGAQPTGEHADELPTNLKGQAGQIMALARALKFAEPELASLIQNTFGTIVMPGKLAAAVEFMTGEEHRELIRELKQRLGGR